MPRLRVVPWTSEKEFIQVAEWIYSEDQDQQRNALETMNTWRCRALPSKIPRAISCTADLVSTDCHCELGLALALMRFVSLISSEEQDRNQFNYALPVHSMAGKIGIPSWLVDLRNDIAHNALPKLPILLDARERALLWLRNNYWTQHVNAYYTQQDDLLAAHKELEVTLMEYQKKSFECLGNKSLSSQDVRSALKPTISSVCRLLKNSSLCSRGLQFLLTPGFLLPTSEQLRALKLRSMTVKQDLANKFAGLWIPLLTSMKDSDILSKLIDATFHEMTQCTPPTEDEMECEEQNSHEQLVNWCRAWLIAIRACEDKQNDCALSKCLNHEAISKIHWSRILCTVVFENKSAWKAEIFYLVLDTYLPKLSEDVKKSLKLTRQLSLSSSSSFDSKKNQSIGDVSEVCNASESGDVIWKMENNLINWADYPIGICPNFSLDDWSKLIVDL